MKKNSFRQLLRSQFYSLLTETKFILLIFLVMGVICYLASWESVGESLVSEENYLGIQELKAATIFGASGGYLAEFAMLFVFITVGYFASRDFDDKTVNYEIAGGHDRREIFLSRSVAVMTLGAVGGGIMLFAVPIVNTLVYGWGDGITFGTAALRVLLVTLLFIRVSAELLLAASILKKTFLVYIAGAGLSIIVMVITSDFSGSKYVLATSAGTALMEFKFFSFYHTDETMELFFDSTITGGTAAAVAVSYLLVTAGCLYIGCKLFCRADLD